MPRSALTNQLSDVSVGRLEESMSPQAVKHCSGAATSHPITFASWGSPPASIETVQTYGMLY